MPDIDVSFDDWVILGQAVDQWLLAFVTLFAVVVIVAWLRRRIERQASPEGIIGDIRAAVMEIRRLPILGVAVFLASQWLTVSPSGRSLLHDMFVVAVGVQIALSANVVVRRLLERYVMASRELTGASLGVLGTLSEVVIWVIAILMILSNMGINVSGLVASLGIGGVAIALAAQNILGDLFASLSIVLDRPFEPGDFIKVGNELGVVKRVGLKTTRVQALQGEELVFSNTDLLGSRIQNFKKMRERRVSLEVGLVYSTPMEQLKEMPGLIEASIRAAEGARFDRAHFRSFGDSALMFEAVYYVETGDYAKFMDLQQTINLGLLDRLRTREMDIAFPTRTVHVEGMSTAPLAP